ncbi:hypothetical protein GCM10014715_78190 [Streptomyces spiralis]|uniref:Uncharacterized protein n=1 Tax=Streptomyces spiralis TaxID=66376 RepID=A0A919E3S7_9ACTN|nr:hypothetical protein [Streptomyces spiralis]GHF10898.1 hypothetical protein GCM10014715_78190 [Streptomyces spiralis]
MRRFLAALSHGDKDQEAMTSLLRRVNCQDRREPDGDVEKAVLDARRLAAVTLLGSFL